MVEKNRAIHLGTRLKKRATLSSLAARRSSPRRRFHKFLTFDTSSDPKINTKNSALSLDNVSNFLHSGFEKMKTISIFRRLTKPQTEDQDSQIRVYRSHAARAISEERWEVAEIFLDRILTVDPHHTEAWLMKGHLRHHCREDEQTALDCYRKVINLCGPDSTHPHAQRARSSLGRLLSVWS